MLIQHQSQSTVTLSFPYDPLLLDVVKAIPGRAFVFQTKKWVIKTDQVPILLAHLKTKPPTPNIQDAIVAIQDFLTPPVLTKNVAIKSMDTMMTLGGRTPFVHQQVAVEALLNQCKMLLGDEMGLGKTGTSVLTGSLIQGRKLVVCPASLKLNWKKEIGLFAPNSHVVILGGKKRKIMPAVSDWQDDGWLVVNYDLLPKFEKEINQVAFSVLFLDEAHYVKALNSNGEASSKRATAALRLAKQCPHVYPITGTPIPNRVKDVWNILQSIDHPLAKKNFFSFANRYCNAKMTPFGWDFEGASNTKELHEKLKPYMIRRLKDEVTDLPEKIRSFIPVEVDLKGYEQALNDYYTNHNVTQYADPDVQQLVQLTGMRIELAKAKITSTIELAETVLENESCVIIFTCYQAVIDAVMAHFKDDCVKLTGACSNEKKEQAKALFQAGKKKVIVMNLQAGGVGHTLTKASAVIFNDLYWVPTDHLQAEDRVHRIGQVNRCNIYYVYAQGAEIDEILAGSLNSKLKHINRAIEGLEIEPIGVEQELMRKLHTMKNKNKKTSA